MAIPNLGIDFNFGSPDIGGFLAGASAGIPKTGNLPWAGVSNPGPQKGQTTTQVPTKSAFFRYFAPDPNLWDKLVDYRLVVIDTANGNTVVGGDVITEVQVNPLGNGTLAFSPMTNAWEFFLPITPQQLSITDAYAINTSATLRGILEEHSGVRFKNISVQGTFGVWPGRPAIVNPPGTPGLLQSVFGGTIAAAQNVATQFQSVINTISTGSSASKPVTTRPDNTWGSSQSSVTITNPSDPEYGGTGTGYFQTIMLQQFLEQYAEAKRNPVNAAWRLVFDIPKQKQSFVVSPVSFTWNENQNRPMEINYNLQLKAWRRIDLHDQTTQVALEVTQLTPGVLQTILNTISAAQNTAAASYNLIGSVRSDVDNILNIIRQTGIFVKQLAGVAIAVSDLPAQLVSDAKTTISQFLSTLSKNSLFGPAATDAPTLAVLSGIQSQSTSIYEGTPQPNLGAAIAALAAANAESAAKALAASIAAIDNSPGLAALIAANNALGANVAAAQLQVSSASNGLLNPSNVVFTNPLQYPLLFGQVPVNSLLLNSAQQNALQTELTNVGNFTVANLKAMRATILTLCTQLSNSFGAGNAYYSTLFNQPTPIVTNEPMTADDYSILTAFYELVQAYDVLTATNQLDNNQILNNMEYVAALAATSDIEFSIPNSKIQVPVPYGLTMEQIAMRYLGDPQRWLEIATLNALRENYIDENGFVLPLLSNADGRSIVVGNDYDLFLAQTVYLNSSTQPSTARTIINIVPLSPTSFLVTLDGLANLDVFTTVDGAYIQAYLPGTVNSQNVIWMPSDIETVADDQINIPASVANVDLVGLSKVDWLLTPSGDLAITNTGDFRLAAGITNIIQALTLKFSTQQGTSLLNPDFGLPVKAGQMVSDINASTIYKQIVAMITADPRFAGVSGLQVVVSPPSVAINLGVQLAGQTGIFPVNFQLGNQM